MKKLWVLVMAAALLLSVGAFAQSTDKSDQKKDQANTSAFDKGAQPAQGKIDINSASKEELTALKGVGDKTAMEIISHRPYKAKNDLVKEKIVTPKVYAQIKDHIVAHRTEAASEQK